ncbi:putative DELLA protein RGL2 [Hibiscus syriacus]|uniref:DELLA protein RGL2 n=1 Tax=Hibiscus syriacus TaxID=106335 RepID=A0A6A2Y6V5_HIBSY|nr:uncharacterized protein LOC120172517 [Hibiscus syriacus]KAE8672106.1 putative DELLA protein RGL2 [Hibiscus syriacus]
MELWWKNLYQKSGKFLISPTMKQSFHLLAILLLSLWLPLAFLLVARLSFVNYVLNATVSDPSTPSFLWSFYFYTNPALIYLLITSVSIAALAHGLTGKLSFVTESTDTTTHRRRLRLYIAWIVLCVVQVSVGLGIEGSVAVGVDGAGFGVKRSFFSRMIFFLGLHEIILVWFRTVVKPVADDSIFGCVSEERWVYRTAIAVAAGTLWWWKLRDEVESLVVVVEAKKELSMDIEMADFLGWWIYYLTVTIGMVRVAKALLWLGFVLLCRRDHVDETISEEEDEDKV